MNYDLDATPSEKQGRILWRIRDGDRIVTRPGGRGYAWERGGRPPPKDAVARLLDNQWIISPCRDGPLFGQQRDGCLTNRGEFALLRYQSQK
jgi:hypothetical protein